MTFGEEFGGISDAELSNTFQGYLSFKKRVGKSLYFANKLPTTSGLSLPLAGLAVKTFAEENAYKADGLDIFDLDAATEIARNACVAPTALVMALVYLRRLSVSNPEYLRTVKPTELFLVSVLVASKFMQDEGEDTGVYNDEWASSSKIELKRLNELELQFLLAIDWRVNVTTDEFTEMFSKVEQRVALTEGLFRGWFTYTEIAIMQPLGLCWKTLGVEVVESVVQVFAALSVAYLAVAATVWATTLWPYLYVISENTLYWKIMQTTQIRNIVPCQPSALDLSFGMLPGDYCNGSDVLSLDLAPTPALRSDAFVSSFKPFNYYLDRLQPRYFEFGHRTFNGTASLSGEAG